MNGLLRPVVGVQDADCPSVPDRSLRIALASLQRCRRSVRALPLFAHSERPHRALSGLTAWYERVCEDEHYMNAAPTEGRRALARMAKQPKTAALSSVVVATKAVDVADELVACRRAAAAGSEADPTTLEAALSALAAAMRAT